MRLPKLKKWPSVARGLKSKRCLLAVALSLVLGLFAITRPLPHATEVDYSSVILSEEGTLLRAYLTRDEKWRFPVNSDQLEKTVQTLVCLEDKRFFNHFGVDPLALARAGYQWAANGRVISGGSTITMQVARLLEPKPRTLSSKFLEILRATQLEARLSKKQILDLYLSYAPFGGNIEGIEAASQRYFARPARELGFSELAFLFLLPQSPHRWDRYSQSKLKHMRERNLERLARCGLLTRTQLAKANQSPIPGYRIVQRQLAPHLGDTLTARDPFRDTWQTTLSFSMQQNLERWIRAKKKYYANQGVHNVAVIVVENNSYEIKALLGNFSYGTGGGSQDFGSFQIPRSVGSTLKPLLFTQLIESGEIVPESLWMDVPTEYDDYKPENYSGQFTGLVTAKQALAQSYNVPFIRALKRFGLDRFLSQLSVAGLSTPLPLDRLGLSVIVGALELSPLDLAKMYTGLANFGRIRPLRLVRSDMEISADSWQWFSEGAVLLTRETLALRNRPDFPISHQNIRSTKKIHWKTGTSQGRRDAWSIGFDDKYTVLVWMGNLTNEPSPALVGSEAAAPVMFDIFRMISPHRERLVQLPWDSLESVELCAFSGYLAGPNCSHKQSGFQSKAHRLSRLCPYHRKVLVDEGSGLRVHANCKKNLPTEFRSVVHLSQEVLFWARKQVKGLETVPSYHPNCRTRHVRRGKLKILSPGRKKYFVFQGSSSQKQLAIPIRLHSPGKLSEVACFLDGKIIQLGEFELSPHINVSFGSHTFFCSDRAGRSGEVSFEVRSL